MKTRLIALVLLAALILPVLTACGGNSGIITEEDAQKIALVEAGLTADQVSDIHTHITEENGIPCYEIHMTTAEGEISYIIAVSDGEILGIA